VQALVSSVFLGRVAGYALRVARFGFRVAGHALRVTGYQLWLPRHYRDAIKIQPHNLKI
jgi:hypothetical protein